MNISWRCPPTTLEALLPSHQLTWGVLEDHFPYTGSGTLSGSCQLVGGKMNGHFVPSEAGTASPATAREPDLGKKPALPSL